MNLAERFFDWSNDTYEKIHGLAPTTITVIYLIVSSYSGYSIGRWAQTIWPDKMDDAHWIFTILAPLVFILGGMIIIGIIGGLLWLGETFVNEMKEAGSKIKKDTNSPTNTPPQKSIEKFKYTPEQVKWLSMVYVNIPFVQNLRDKEFDVIIKLVRGKDEFYNADDKRLLNYIRDKWIEYTDGKN